MKVVQNCIVNIYTVLQRRGHCTETVHLCFPLRSWPPQLYQKVSRHLAHCETLDTLRMFTQGNVPRLLCFTETWSHPSKFFQTSSASLTIVSLCTYYYTHTVRLHSIKLVISIFTLRVWYIAWEKLPQGLNIEGNWLKISSTRRVSLQSDRNKIYCLSVCSLAPVKSPIYYNRKPKFVSSPLLTTTRGPLIPSALFLNILLLYNSALPFRPLTAVLKQKCSFLITVIIIARTHPTMQTTDRLQVLVWVHDAVKLFYWHDQSGAVLKR